MHICEVCGKAFDRAGIRGPLPRFCSASCRRGGRKTELTRKCDICGVAYEVSGRGNPPRICSAECKAEKERRRQRGYRKDIERSCEICGSLFLTRNPKSVACSPACQRERVRIYQQRKYLESRVDLPETKVWVCKWCDGEIVVPYSLTGNRVYHDDCRVRARRHRNRVKSVRRQNARVEPNRIDVFDIAERDGFVCHICLDVVDMSLPRTSRFGATLDHVFPLSLGGLDVEENVKLAHWICNIKKSNKLEVDDA